MWKLDSFLDSIFFVKFSILVLTFAILIRVFLDSECNFLKIWLVPAYKDAWATLFVVAPVKTGPIRAVPGAAQFVNSNNKNNVNKFLDIKITF